MQHHKHRQRVAVRHRVLLAALSLSGLLLLLNAWLVGQQLLRF